MKIRFLTKPKHKTQHIYIRAYHSNIFDLTTSTGLVVSKDDFSNTYQRIKSKASIKSKDAINNKLSELNNHVTDQYNNTILNNDDFGKNWLKDVVNTFFNRVTSADTHKRYLTDWAKFYNETETLNKKTGAPLSKGTLTQHKTHLNTLLSFETHKGNRILLKDVNYDFYKDYLKYCFDIRLLNQNTTGGNIKTLKMWLKEANKRGLCNVDTSDFIKPTNETKDVYLTDTEINKIFKHRLNGNLKLMNVRDLLIVGVWTGLRVSDFMRLDIDKIKGGNIEVKTQKTGKTVIIPVHPQIQAIIKRNDGKLPKAISDQKFNEYVKDVCELVGISEMVEGGKRNKKTNRKEYGTYPKHQLITSHTCRRSFASNLYGKVDNKTIMGITGHNTETQFLEYIKITPKQHANTLKEYWDKQELKKDEIQRMKIAK